jgi:hypothetical protein
MRQNESLGRRLPKIGFTYNGQKPFSDAVSTGIVVRAIKRSRGVKYMYPRDVDHCLGLVLLFAANAAHTIHAHGDAFWQMIMQQVPWTEASSGVNPRMVRELTTHVIKARLRFLKHNVDVPPLQRGDCAMAID